MSRKLAQAMHWNACTEGGESFAELAPTGEAMIVKESLNDYLSRKFLPKLG